MAYVQFEYIPLWEEEARKADAYEARASDETNAINAEGLRRKARKKRIKALKLYDLANGGWWAPQVLNK